MAGGYDVVIAANVLHATRRIRETVRHAKAALRKNGLLVLNELSVVGSFIYDEGGFEAALDLLATDGFPTDLLIEADGVPLEGISDALAGLAKGDLAGKVMVVPGRSNVTAGAAPSGGA